MEKVLNKNEEIPNRSIGMYLEKFINKPYRITS